MPTLCAVFGCVNKSTNKLLSFFRFLKVKSNVCLDSKAKMLVQRMAWFESLKIIYVIENQLNNMRICSIHFKTGK